MANSPEFLAFRERYDRAVQAGLVAAAAVYLGAVSTKLQQGYTSGEFVTGAAAASVTASEPFQEGDGWAIRVGSNLDYTLYWELGHFNLFTRHYERVEHWRNAFDESAAAMQDAFGAAFVAVLEGQEPPTLELSYATAEYQGPVPAADFTVPRSYFVAGRAP